MLYLFPVVRASELNTIYLSADIYMIVLEVIKTVFTE